MIFISFKYVCKMNLKDENEFLLVCSVLDIWWSISTLETDRLSESTKTAANSDLYRKSLRSTNSRPPGRASSAPSDSKHQGDG